MTTLNTRVIKPRNKRSENARSVARQVALTVGKGKLVNMKDILKTHGYAPSILKNPNKVIDTKSFQEAIKNVVPTMETLRAKILVALQKRDMDTVKFNELLSGLEILTKNIQIISGKSTENVAIHVEISESIAKKNKLLEQTATPTTTQTEQVVKEIVKPTETVS